MNNERIEQGLRKAVEELTPDVFDAVSGAPVCKIERTDDIMTKKKKSTAVISILAAAACLLVTGVLGNGYYKAKTNLDSIISIDVNPSIEIKTNKLDRVLSVTPVNEDANAVLDGMELRNVELKTALNAITGSMVKQGYFDNEGGGVLVTVENSDSRKAEKIKAEAVTQINAALAENQKDASVFNKVAEFEDETIRSTAEQYGISFGKAAFVLELCALDPALKPETLANRSLYEIAQLIKSKGIEVDDIVDIDDDDDYFEDIDDKFEKDFYTATQPANAKYIEKDAAINTALANAKLEKSAVKRLTAELDIDDGRAKYDVEFIHGMKEYDYEIDAVTGKIIDISFEIEAENIIEGNAPTGSGTYTDDDDDDLDDILEDRIESHLGIDDYKYDDDRYDDDRYDDGRISSTAPVAQSDKIGSEKAKQAALAHAGLAEGDVTALTVREDNDDGRAVYDVEFRRGAREYNYEIDAVSGKILEADNELFD